MSFGTVTSWLTITSAWPMQAGCSSALWNVWSTAIVAFDPGYGLGVDSLFSCLPPAATTWWEQSHTSYSGTTFRLGPLVCPQAYTTASTSKQDETSTFIACCPSEYTFATLFFNGAAGECLSDLIQGQVVNYMSQTSASSWVTITATANSGWQITGIQMNGWVINQRASSSPASETSSSTTTPTPSPTTTPTPSPTMIPTPSPTTTPTPSPMTTPTPSPTTTLKPSPTTTLKPSPTTTLKPSSTNTSTSSSTITPTSSPMTSPTSQPSSIIDDDSNSTGSNVGIGVGVSIGAVGIIALGVAFWYVRRQRRNLAVITAQQSSDSPKDFWTERIRGTGALEAYELEAYELQARNASPIELG